MEGKLVSALKKVTAEAKLVHVQLEEVPESGRGGIGLFAYYTEMPTSEQLEADAKNAKAETYGYPILNEDQPTDLSKHANLKRIYLGERP